MEEDTDIDVRSEVVRDYLERIPNNLVRWGTTIIFIIVALAVILTWLIKYPSLIRAEFKLTTQVAPKSVIARVDGRLDKLLVTNHQKVENGQILGFLQSTANYKEILQLKNKVDKMRNEFKSKEYSDIYSYKFYAWSHLGEVQPAYQTFYQQHIQLNYFLINKYYSKNIYLLNNDILELKMMNSRLKEQYNIYERDATLSESEFSVNQNLFEKKVIPKIDLDREESKMLAKKLPSKGIKTSILNNNIQINLKQKEIIELNKQLFQQKANFEEATNLLISSIDSWISRYALISPSSGMLTFSNNLQEKDNIKINSELFQVLEKNTIFIGTLIIPQSNLGKVTIGQRVLIKFQSYPFEEYGLVEGKISSIPELSNYDNNSFFALVELPHGLKTSHNKIISYKYGMTADAEIVTEDMRLIERIFYTIKRIFK